MHSSFFFFQISRGILSIYFPGQKLQSILSPFVMLIIDTKSAYFKVIELANFIKIGSSVDPCIRQVCIGVTNEQTVHFPIINKYLVLDIICIYITNSNNLNDLQYLFLTDFKIGGGFSIRRNLYCLSTYLDKLLS